jgi:TRAP-type C4-dicarboxylate transport system permease small subunit
MSVYERALKVAVGLLLLGITGLVVAQVFFRFVLSSPLPWPEELARLIFVYLVFVGGAFASLHNDQISIEVVDVALDGSSKKASVTTIVRETIMVIVMAVTVVGGIQVAPRAHRIALSGTGLPKSLMTVAVIIGATLMGLEALRRIVIDIRKLIGSRER